MPTSRRPMSPQGSVSASSPRSATRPDRTAACACAMSDTYSIPLCPPYCCDRRAVFSNTFTHSSRASIRRSSGGASRHWSSKMASDPRLTPIPAATVLMLRDGRHGLEVFLLKRHGLSDVLGGAYVFPGGKVDLADAHAQLLAHLDTPAAALHAALNEPQLDLPAAAALYVAALREAFEETGVLYASGAGAKHAASATSLSREGRAFDEVVALSGLKLAASALQPWSRWITPSVGGVM